MRKHPASLIAALFLATTFIICATGCYKDAFEFDKLKQDFITWEPDLAYPLVYSTVTPEEIIGLSDETNIYHYDNDHFISLTYRKTIFSQMLNDFFQLTENQTTNESMSLTAGEIITFTTTGKVEKTKNSSITMALTGPGGSKLKQIILDSGKMNISFTSYFEHNGTLLVTMPEMTLNGVPFSQEIPINYNGGSESSPVSVNLKGYEMNFKTTGPANSLTVNYTLTLNKGAGATPTIDKQLKITQSFQNMAMEFAKGDFGNFDLVINPADVDLDVLQTEHGGKLYFEDPKFKLTIKNSIGAEMLVSIDELYAINDLGQTNIDLSALIPTNQFTVQPAPSPGNPFKLSYLFTKDNSNVKTFINNEFEQIHHDFAAEVNPNGPAENFASKNSSVEVVADVELPFYGFADHFTITDTIEVPFNEAEGFADKVERALLRINCVSHFPADGLLKLYFVDENYQVIDSVLTEDDAFIIESGKVKEIEPDVFKVIETTNTNNDIELDKARIKSLFDAKYFFLISQFTTTDNAGKNIKIYLEDDIEMKIGIRAKFKAAPSAIGDFSN
ncbi:hypothetical protein ACFLR1_03140 [Bacteroidota bacterium]